MSDMVRKQIYIRRQQQAMLKHLSAQTRGLSESEIIRQAIDREAAKSTSQNLANSQEAWQKAYQFMLSLPDRASQYNAPYRWNRGEIYEERLNRYAPQAGQDPETEINP